jgi:methylenetetrahydrofolate reductase (NADPH)
MADDRSLPRESGLVRTLLAGDKAVTAEITPPLSAAAKDLTEKALPLKGVVDAVNVTDGASARSHMSNVVAAALLVQSGMEPILQFTCRDRNRIALQSDLLGASAMGVHNILVLGGDDPKQGDQPDAKPVFDLNTSQVIAMAHQMCVDGTILSGREISSPPSVFIGAADTPIDPADDWKPDRLMEKVDAGARFAQTQFCFDMEILKRYVARLRDNGVTERLKYLVGIGPIASAKSAVWMRENLWGVIMPDDVVARLDGAEDQKAEGRKICAEQIQEILEIDGVAGVHIMAIRQEDAIPDILKAARAGPQYR